MKSVLEITEEVEKEEDVSVNEFWRRCKFNIDENYEYVPKSIVFSAFSNLIYYGIAAPVLSVLTKIVYDFKIEGKENLENIQTGAISVSNHVLVLDCAMIGLACEDKKIYYTTIEDNFKIPFIRRLIKLLRAIPIPENLNNKKGFIKAVDDILNHNGLLHFYPESSLISYCNKIRNFKNGAFDLAVRNNVPIIPMVYSFRQPKGIRRFIKRKPDVTLTILKPISCEENELTLKQKAYKLKGEVYCKMQEELERKNAMW